MPTVNEVTHAPLSGRYYVDALLDNGPGWNYLTSGNNTIYYTFAVDRSNARESEAIAGSAGMLSASQRAIARDAMSYISDITGINFVETSVSAEAQVHLWSGDLTNEESAGYCTWNTHYRYDGSFNILEYEANAWIYLDSGRYGTYNADLTPGSGGYQVLLHELGHMLGLKHSFAGDITLPQAEDNTAHTLMSYTFEGGPYDAFGYYDYAALAWLYGGDGLGGELGINSAGGGQVLFGSLEADLLKGGNGDDLLFGGPGNDSLDGGTGIDTVLYGDARAGYVISKAEQGFRVKGPDSMSGEDLLLNDERILFEDKGVALDVDGVAGQAYRLYKAAFDREPDLPGFGFWLARMDGGQSLLSVAQGFMGSPEFTTVYGGPDPESGRFLTNLYDNVLHRAPDQAGYDHFLREFARGVSKAEVLMIFSESAENQAQLVGLMQNGVEYLPYQA
ncbi:DUF4214 domain-containing protein [Massilia endophytica]|uniref:DUF4214 domain-containing protein n=1 Tax=Massilia endophytica TaxID=2899220 RepID=UPI001E3EF24D|nr:DUF4214 domain-containing protein [Massilia endophytica]UGQ45464.1 DUF4214 domain-containing protein [Massilia endophytica]